MLSNTRNLALLLLCLVRTSASLAEDQHVHGEHSTYYYEFVENRNQWHENVHFKALVPNGALFMEKNTLTYNFYDASEVFALHGNMNGVVPDEVKVYYHALKVHFENSNPVEPVGLHTIPTYFNYFLGNDPKQWASRCRGFQQVKYAGLYPQTDFVMYTKDNAMKYDFILHPGADANNIKLRYEGVENMHIQDGKLIIPTSVVEITELAPYAYQIIDGKEVEVSCEFRLQGNTLFFGFPNEYNKAEELIIDPTMIFATYSGSTANNFGYTAAPDRYGFLYAGGSAFGVGYPFTAGAYDTSFNGGSPLNTLGGVDMGITKYDTTGTFRVWSSYLGGNNEDLPHSFFVTEQDELYVLGSTSSNNFPTSASAYDNSFGGGTALNLMNGLGVYYDQGSDIVISRFSANGDMLLASTYVGATLNDGMNTDPNTKYNYADEVRGDIEVRNGFVYIVSTTNSTNFPTTPGVFQPAFAGGSQDGVVFKMDDNLSNMVWSSFLGGTDVDALYSIAVSDTGDIYVAGGTRSAVLPMDSAAYDTLYQGGRTDGIVFRITNNGDSVLDGTYLGSTTYDQIYFVELDRSGNTYVYGQTEITDSTFIDNALYYTYGSGQFITKLDPQLDTITWSTVFGAGNGINISPTAFLVDLCNSVYLSGWGGSVNQSPNNNAGFVNNMDTLGPYPAGVFGVAPNGSDFYLMVLADDASTLKFGGFFGGPSAAEHVDGGTSRFDRKGKIYQSMCAGCGGFSDMYTSPSAVGPTNNNSCNNGVFKIDFNLPIVIADFDTDSICGSFTYNFINLSLTQSNSQFQWLFGDGDSSVVPNPTHTYSGPGQYTVMLIVSDTGTCNLADTMVQTVNVDSVNIQTLTPFQVCPGDSVQIGIPPSGDPGATYSWWPSSSLSDPFTNDPIAFPTTTTQYVLTFNDSTGCVTYLQDVSTYPISLSTDPNQLLCLSASTSASFSAYSAGSAISYQWSSNSQFTDMLNANLNDSTFTVNPTVEDTAWYYIQIQNQIGCTLIDSVQLIIDNFIVSSSNDEYICQGDSIQLVAQAVTPGDVVSSYTWTPTSTIIGSNTTATITVNPTSTTTYSVAAVNQNGCTNGAQSVVTVSNLTQGAVSAASSVDTVVLGLTTILIAEPTGGGYTYSWSPSATVNDPTAATTVASPTTTTSYVVTVEDENGGCVFMDTVEVFVKEIICGVPNLFIPNAFTPNDDGENDELFVRGRNLEKLYFTVYNRWGEKVFETTDQDVGWDGYFKGMKADPDVFVWYLEATCVDKTEIFEKGNVTLIR